MIRSLEDDDLLLAASDCLSLVPSNDFWEGRPLAVWVFLFTTDVNRRVSRDILDIRGFTSRCVIVVGMTLARRQLTPEE